MTELGFWNVTGIFILGVCLPVTLGPGSWLQKKKNCRKRPGQDWVEKQRGSALSGGSIGIFKGEWCPLQNLGSLLYGMSRHKGWIWNEAELNIQMGLSLGARLEYPQFLCPFSESLESFSVRCMMGQFLRDCSAHGEISEISWFQEHDGNGYNYHDHSVTMAVIMRKPYRKFLKRDQLLSNGTWQLW